MTTKEMIQEWFERGVEDGATHMIVVCDTFDHEDYPVFVHPNEDVRSREQHYKDSSMQKIMEVYNLSMGMWTQLNERQAFNY